MKRFSFDIDVAGACNLRCPSCPQGNIKNYRLPVGYMGPSALEQILRKALSECHVTAVGLFSWAEPLLNPALPDLVRLVQDSGISCFLSSNLNILPNAEALMAANPFSFRISASGFTQKIYGYTHRGGNIDRVKNHMMELADAKEHHKANTRIYVYYHRYRHNLKEEPLMREFAEGLGIGFQPVWALLFPIEKILGYAGAVASDFPLTEEDLRLINGLALPLKEALKTAEKYRERSCRLREAQISLDYQGRVQLCCGIFDAAKFTLGNYLDMPLDDIQRLRQEHGMCISCMRSGGHVYVTQDVPEFDELALANIDSTDVKLLDLRHEIAQKHLRRRLESIYDRFFSGVMSIEQKTRLGDLFDRILRFVSRSRPSRH